MKILLTGAGGGHFYPLIAVAESLRELAFSSQVPNLKLYFASDNIYDEQALSDLSIEYIKISAGKLSLEKGIMAYLGIFGTLLGILIALYKIYKIFPDVIFAKGGYASIPVSIASKFYGIPIIVHESDSVPGRSTTFIAKLAESCAVSYPEMVQVYGKFAPTVLTGLPIRKDYLPKLGFKREIIDLAQRPTILVIGGSTGAVRLNNYIINSLSELLNLYNVIHVCGKTNLQDVKLITESLLKTHPHKESYEVYGFANLANLYQRADVCITRAGSSMFECALWNLPILAVPIPEEISRDQRINAYTMSSYGVAKVIEEPNFSTAILMATLSEMSEKENYSKYLVNTEKFKYSLNASKVIAERLFFIAKSHY